MQGLRIFTSSAILASLW